MKANGSANQDMFEDFEPLCVWHRFADREILEVHLRGFKKENLRVQVTHKNMLSVTGDRPLNDGKKRSRFEKKIELSNHINTKEIRAKLGGCGTLSLIMPKKLDSIQNPTKHNNGGSKQEERNNGDDVTSGFGMKLMMKCKKMAPMVVVVVVLAAMVVGFGAFIAQKCRPRYPVEN